MGNKANIQFKEKINNYAIVHYKKITKEKVIKAEFALSNAACHYNAVAAVRAGRADKVWLAWVGGSKGVVHVINSKKGKFFDETWHDYDTPIDIRIIRQIDPSEFSGIRDVLMTTKKVFFEMFGKKQKKITSFDNTKGVI